MEVRPGTLSLDPAKGIALGTLGFVWVGEGADRAADDTTLGPLSSPNKNSDCKGNAFAGVWGSAPALLPFKRSPCGVMRRALHRIAEAVKESDSAAAG